MCPPLGFLLEYSHRSLLLCALNTLFHLCSKFACDCLRLRRCQATPASPLGETARCGRRAAARGKGGKSAGPIRAAPLLFDCRLSLFLLQIQPLALTQLVTEEERTMSVHESRHAQSVGDLIDAIAAADTSLSEAINTHWTELLAAIDRTTAAEELTQAVNKIETLIGEHPKTRSQWWLVKQAVERGLSRLRIKGKHVIFLRAPESTEMVRAHRTVAVGILLRRHLRAHCDGGESPPSPHLRDAHVGCLLGWGVRSHVTWRRNLAAKPGPS